MGISTTYIDTERAKRIARNSGYVVYEGSSEEYFGNKKWLRDVVSAELILENQNIHFKLGNGDFVTVENEVSK